MAGEPLIYRDAEEDEAALLEAVKDKYHAALPFDIGLYFRNKPKTTGDTIALATAHKSNPLMLHLTGCEGYVEVWEEGWDREEQAWREYLLDHELAHFSVNDKGELEMRNHNIEDFEEVLQRHPEELTKLRRRLEGEVSHHARQTTD